MKKNAQRAVAVVAALTLGTGFALGSASAASAVDTWTITSLSLTNPVLIDAATTAGDDGGFLAVTQKHVLLNGNSSLYAYDLATLAEFAATDAETDEDYWNYASDLKSNTAYQLIDDGGISSITVLDDDGNLTSTVVTLSETINLSSEDWFLMSGFGWIGLWEYVDGTLKLIDPVTGVVTTVFAKAITDFSPQPETGANEDTGSFDGSGVGMFDGTDYWFVASDENNDISKFKITNAADQAVMLVNANPQTAETDNFAISTCVDRFYVHNESPGGAWFGQNTTGMQEPLLSADATFSSAGTCPQEPELPNTGVDAGATAAFVAVLATLGLAGVVIARRRQVTTK